MGMFMSVVNSPGDSRRIRIRREFNSTEQVAPAGGHHADRAALVVCARMIIHLDAWRPGVGRWNAHA
jgi:hypothetical protein